MIFQSILLKASYIQLVFVCVLRMLMQFQFKALALIFTGLQGVWTIVFCVGAFFSPTLYTKRIGHIVNLHLFSGLAEWVGTHRYRICLIWVHPISIRCLPIYVMIKFNLKAIIVRCMCVEHAHKPDLIKFVLFKWVFSNYVHLKWFQLETLLHKLDTRTQYVGDGILPWRFILFDYYQ